jgi:hypothetical protein
LTKLDELHPHECSAYMGGSALECHGMPLRLYVPDPNRIVFGLVVSCCWADSFERTMVLSSRRLDSGTTKVTW